MSREEDDEEDGQRYVPMPPEPEASSASFWLPETARAFDELPRARIMAVSRPDAGDITPMLLSYTLELQYKQVCTARPPLHRPQIQGIVGVQWNYCVHWLFALAILIDPPGLRFGDSLRTSAPRAGAKSGLH
jgi:hypothetical protein